MREEKFKSKYHRSEPIRKFNVDDTLYNTVMNTNEKTMNLKYSKYFIFEKNFYNLKDETDKLATALKRDEVQKRRLQQADIKTALAFHTALSKNAG